MGWRIRFSGVLSMFRMYQLHAQIQLVKTFVFEGKKKRKNGSVALRKVRRKCRHCVMPQESRKGGMRIAE